jgi:hypothetical protein
VANVLVAGGPLDGTSIDVWLPDTVEGLASATMKLYRETDDPDLLTLWESADGAVWVYQGAGAYMCVFRSALFAEGSKTRRIDTPSLTEWTP